MSTLTTRLFTWLYGEGVGQDAQGNRYFRDKRKRGIHPESLRQERRWVLYNGPVEASRVPPEWHAWLHHTSNDLPSSDSLVKRPWMKEHKENLTGTDRSYLPPGHTLRGGKRSKATGDYEAWRPD